MWSELNVQAGLTLVGVVAGALVTAIAGIITARRKGVTDVTIAEIGDRQAFYALILDRAEKAEAMVAAAAETERGLLRENASLKRRVDELEAQMAQLTGVPTRAR